MTMIDARGMGIAVVGLAAAALAAPASAQVLLSEGFESGPAGWTSTGGTELGFSGNPGQCLQVPYADWYWITLATDAPGVATGDLTRHGGALRFSLDINVTQLNNWNNEPMDPGIFPLVIQFVDATDPLISVFYVGDGMPNQTEGWRGRSFQVPDPTGTALPAGWGGTGAEGPLGEPMLPANRTYRSVMENVGEVRFTTAVPGYFYIPSFWEVAFDNVVIERVGGTAPCYANCDGSTTAPILNVSDFICFQNKYAANDPSANCDGSTIQPVLNVSDFICFQSLYAAGCP